MVVVCVVCMFIYCLQLERFLCRDCGKVKCSCEIPPAANHHLNSSEESGVRITDREHNENYQRLESVEHRNLYRRNSGPEKSENISQKPPPQPQQRASEVPFTRSTQGENGKLRRSFAVRSREGLENLLSFATKKGQDHTKTKQTF